MTGVKEMKAERSSEVSAAMFSLKHFKPEALFGVKHL